MAGGDTRTRFASRKFYRGSQVIFGERQHLREVLVSLQGAKLPPRRRSSEVSVLKKLIRLRTRELNRISSSWDRKFQKARNPQTTAQELLRLAMSLSLDDYLLARVLTEHPKAPSELLEYWASHAYSAVRENVARHPNTPPTVLRKLAESTKEPLWFLVACNPATPEDLRTRLRNRMKQMAATP